MKPLSIPIGDSFIEGTLFHRWGGNEDHYRGGALRLSGLGAICFTITLRGHGNTSHERDSVSRTDNLHDTLTAFDRLAAEEGVDPQRLGVVGSSYGGYLA